MPGYQAHTFAQETIATPPLLSRIRATFLAPARLAGFLRGSLPWLDVLLLSTAIAAISVLAMPDDVFIEPMREAVSRRGEPVEITSPPAAIARWGRAMAMLATIATHPILIVTLAGLLTLVFSVLSEGRAGFREYLSLAAHAMLIPALGSALVFTIRLLAGDLDARILAAVGRPPDEGSLLLASLSAVDPFVIWMMVVLAFGAHGFDERHSLPRATAVLIGGYLLVVLMTTALLYPTLA
jgi:hypothetical protein